MSLCNREGKKEVSSNSAHPRLFIVVPYPTFANIYPPIPKKIQSVKEPENLACDFLLLR